MKKILLSFVIGVTALFFVTGNVQAITITPSFQDIPGFPGSAATLLTLYNTEIGSDVNAELSKYQDQKDLAKGFANANIYSAQAATFQGYQNYSLFAITAGVMVGVQAPSIKPSYYDEIGDDLEEKGDIDAGVGAGVSFFNLGINAGFIMKDLYLNLKFGSIKFKPADEVEIKNTLIGIGANYGLIKGGDIGWGFLKWRGLSIGTGFLYHKSEVDVTIELDSYRSSTDLSGIGLGGYFLYADPSITLGVETTTYTIPFDITTSVRLLWFLNVTLGAGVDFSFGNSDIIIMSAGGLRVSNGITNYPVGSLLIDGSTRDVAPSFIRPRVMAGIGFNLWMVKIDIPVIYYPATGAAVGLTAGVVW